MVRICSESHLKLLIFTSQVPSNPTLDCYKLDSTLERASKDLIGLGRSETDSINLTSSLRIEAIQAIKLRIEAIYGQQTLQTSERRVQMACGVIEGFPHPLHDHVASPSAPEDLRLYRKGNHANLSNSISNSRRSQGFRPNKHTKAH